MFGLELCFVTREKMPQEIRVLRCFNCELFQTDIVKKSNKWQCKTCNSKQTVRREYGRGCGATCRIKVQELNMRSGEEQKMKNDNLLELLNSNDVDEYDWDAIASAERNDNDLGEGIENNQQDMFNYSSTKRWSRAAIEKDSNGLNASNKSKWDSYS